MKHIVNVLNNINFISNDYDMEYKYLGDKLTDSALKNKHCKAVRRANGKCIRSKMSTMLVEFEDGTKHNILARRLVKNHCDG